jgi:predicted DNA-binding protein with PD1-like motif
VIVIEVRDGELLEPRARQAAGAGVKGAAIVSLTGAADRFILSAMPPDDATRDVLTSYGQPAEISGTGEIVSGAVHVHATMAISGDQGLSGHLHQAHNHTRFARAYIVPGAPPAP